MYKKIWEVDFQWIRIDTNPKLLVLENKRWKVKYLIRIVRISFPGQLSLSSKEAGSLVALRALHNSFEEITTFRLGAYYTHSIHLDHLELDEAGNQPRIKQFQPT
jgi:hypothetical protein